MKKLQKLSLGDLSKKEMGKSMQSKIKGGGCPLAQCQCNTVITATTRDAIQARLSMYGIP